MGKVFITKKEAKKLTDINEIWKVRGEGYQPDIAFCPNLAERWLEIMICDDWRKRTDEHARRSFSDLAFKLQLWWVVGRQISAADIEKALEKGYKKTGCSNHLLFPEDEAPETLSL